jgi:hypothetical protein
MLKSSSGSEIFDMALGQTERHLVLIVYSESGCEHGHSSFNTLANNT